MRWNPFKRKSNNPCDTPVECGEDCPGPTDEEMKRRLNFDPPQHEGVMSSIDVASALRNSGPMGVIGQTGPTPGAITIAAEPNPTPTLMIGESSRDSIVAEVGGHEVAEAWQSRDAMVDRPVGSLGFAAGITYIMTNEGWVNLGQALSQPEPVTDRRGAIRAQKERKANGTR